MNKSFNEILKEAFIRYLNTSPRSNEKLKILHGFVAKTIFEKLGNDYQIDSINLDGGKEKVIFGSYMPKKVDITISKIIDNELTPIAGIAIKFIMSNYFQNSNNYFENMLGETSNIRKAGIPYFQMLIIDHFLPYFEQSKHISKWEEITSDKLLKYKILSFEDIKTNLFIPNKTFLQIINKKFKNYDIKDLMNCNDLNEYKDFCLNNEFVFENHELNNFNYGNSMILNDYDKFIDFIVDTVKSNLSYK
ncbi:hypothetical protein [Mycoplasma sp. E35C]|uniref:hypothetical protein n=1 Tax=Mycoplasma sp. E35C TaxID=2801918 RepID=UPI001CA3D067|nr:hypothetical protein [Mycoplasma sp. E35C]QZX49306.1 hypothetical protein JJE79_00945 [Mycoplasma sp. E35C]